MTAAQVAILVFVPIMLLIVFAMPRERSEASPRLLDIVIPLSISSAISFVFSGASGCNALEFFTLSGVCNMPAFVPKIVLALHLITVLTVSLALGHFIRGGKNVSQ